MQYFNTSTLLYSWKGITAVDPQYTPPKLKADCNKSLKKYN